MNLKSTNIFVYKRIHELHACDALAGITAIIDLGTRAIFSINTEKSTEAPLALAALYTQSTGGHFSASQLLLITNTNENVVYI